MDMFGLELTTHRLANMNAILHLMDSQCDIYDNYAKRKI